MFALFFFFYGCCRSEKDLYNLRPSNLSVMFVRLIFAGMNHHPTAAILKLRSEVSRGPVFFFCLCNTSADETCFCETMLLQVSAVVKNFFFCSQTFSLALASTIERVFFPARFFNMNCSHQANPHVHQQHIVLACGFAWWLWFPSKNHHWHMSCSIWIVRQEDFAGKWQAQLLSLFSFFLT